jgi:glycosyltransferase involved in cell wall biosynthesis
LSDGVRFLGRLNRQDLAAAMSDVDVYVHASLEESFGNGVAEAMVAGMPIVAGAHSGAVPWVLGDGACGRLTDVRKPTDIADGIIELLSDRHRAEALGDRARLRAISEFSRAAVAHSFMERYEIVTQAADAEER